MLTDAQTNGADIESRPLRFDHLLAALLLGSMALIAFVNILGRYIFHYSLAFTEEVTIHLFVWLVVVGSGLAFERGSQLGMVTLFRIFPDTVKKTVLCISAGLSAVLFLIVDGLLIHTIYQEITLFQATSAALGIPIWIYYAGVVVLSVFVFRGIWRGARQSLAETHEGAAN